MDKKGIVEKAASYVIEYRKNLPKINRSERPVSNYRMITIFLGDGLEDCMQKVRKTISDLFSNHKSIPKIMFTNEELSNETLVRNRIKEACDNLFLDGSTVRDGSRVCICFVTDSDSVEAIKNVLIIKDELVKNLSFSIGDTGIDYNFFTLANTRTRMQAEKLSEYMTNLNNILSTLSSSEIGGISSFIVGDMYNERNTYISDVNKRYEAIGSCIVLLNSSVSEVSQVLASSSNSNLHTLIGFSQADIPLNTLYVIGFDVFSDIVINYATQNRLGVNLETSFSIEELLKENTDSIKLLSRRLIDGVKNLYISSIMQSGKYSFEQINKSLNGILDKYFEINLSKSLLEVDKTKVRTAFNSYLLNEFNKYGLEHAEKCLIEIIDKEKKSKRDFKLRDYKSELYDYNQANIYDTITRIISNMTLTIIDECLRKARDIVIDMEDNNILTRINRIFSETKIATEKCKRECAVADADVNENLIERYENMVAENMELIITALKNGDIVLSFESQEKFDEVLFSNFERIIASKVLFPRQNNYIDDLETLKNEINGYERWIKRQIDKTCFTLKLSELAAEKLSDESICFLTDLSKDEKMWAIMEQKNYSIVQVSGVSVFRVFKFKKNIGTNDIFALHHLN